jgi:prepilin-type N-terminal cleavage/methylation domain-containing protein
MRVSSKDRQAGFTLVELMIVVAILGVLAAIALPMMFSYIYKAKTIEATSFLSEIRARQESYRADFDQYCNISADETSFYPTPLPGGGQQDWGPGMPAGWTQLGALPPARKSIFGYAVVAGPSGVPHGFAQSRGYGLADDWFIALAAADLDGDGRRVTFEIYSHSQGVYCDQPSGWE